MRESGEDETEKHVPEDGPVPVWKRAGGGFPEYFK